MSLFVKPPDALCAFSREDAVSDSAPDLPYTEKHAKDKHAKDNQTRDTSQHRAQLSSCTKAATKSDYAETVPPHPALAWTPWILLSGLYQGTAAGRIKNQST